MVTSNKFILLLFMNLVLTILIVGFLRGSSSKELLSSSNYASTTATKVNDIDASTPTTVINNSTVEMVDLTRTTNANFTCMKTKTLLTYFSSYVCLYPLEIDIFVSKSFKDGASVWEEAEVVHTMQTLLRYPHLDFIDIGANIGTYTMFAAAMGRSVVAVECFGPNVDRLRRAVQLANVANRVVLVQNAIYKQSGQFLRLSNDAMNVGGQELDVAGRAGTNRTVFYNETSPSDPFIVKTIRFDDLVPILTARGIRGAILKVDIEGSESFVFEGGSQVFDLLDIPMIQMEWMKVRDFPDRVNVLLDFFMKRNYEPRSFQCQLLDRSQIRAWPNDFCWTKKNVTFC